MSRTFCKVRAISLTIGTIDRDGRLFIPLRDRRSADSDWLLEERFDGGPVSRTLLYYEMTHFLKE